MKTSSVSLVLLTAALLAVPALAQNEMEEVDPKPAASGPMKPRHKELIKRYDKNGDGRLDDEEKAAAHAMMRKGGGDAERQRRKEIIKRFDKDGDGYLNDAERAEAEKAREMLDRNGGPNKFRAEVLRRFDKDGDGQLNDAERIESEKFRRETEKKFDANGDGKLDDQEKEAALKDFMAQRGEVPEKKSQ